MWEHVGVIREHDGLNAAVGNLSNALAMANGAVVNGAVANDTAVNAKPTAYADLVTRMENRNLLTVGYVEAIAALNRCESRGAHTRSDYAEHNPTIAHSIAYRMKGTPC